MRGWLAWGLLAVLVTPIGHGQEISDQKTEIPRYIKLDQGWVCVDRNPTQVNRQDCSLRPRSSKDQGR